MDQKPHLFGTLVCTRTTGYNQKPCDEARKEKFIFVDRRTVDDPMKNPEYIGAKWYTQGTNHRVENGMIARDLEERERWVVDIPNAEALEAFCLKYGEIILSVNSDGKIPMFEIEIYDGYRE